MRIRLGLCTCLGLWAAGAAMGQNTAAPLSAIDWLNQNSEALVQPAAQPSRSEPSEPPVAATGLAPSVTVAPLDGPAPQRVGLLPAELTGLDPDLWSGGDPDDLARKLRGALSQRLPAAQELLITLMLAEANPSLTPAKDADWLAARIDALIHVGAIDPALALTEQGDPRSSKPLFARWLTLSLLTRTEQTPCRVLADQPSLRPDEATRVYCTARSGDFETAALLFGTAGALDVLTDTQEQLLARFLDPELFEEEPLPRAPVRPDALTFRLFEAAGAPLPTAPLPLAFAHHDLSEDAGWKAQLEAAERLARAGVLPSNQLLGLYSSRRPAASGGIWDRVAALQAFERALRGGSDSDVSTALPAMWRGMQSAGLEVAFSDLFAQDLVPRDLSPEAQPFAFRMELLSRTYERARPPEPGDVQSRFLMSVARGAPDVQAAGSPAARAVVKGFSAQTPPSDGLAQASPREIGAHLLDVLARLSDAGRGDLTALTQSLADLRALGLEDVARRTALQYLILRADSP